jgi:hypothetical protein
VRAGVAGLFELIGTNPDVAAIIRIAEFGGYGPAKAEVALGRKRIEDNLAEVFAAGWAPVGGISNEAARLLALSTLAMVDAVGFRQPSEPAWDAETTIDLLTDFVLGGLLRLQDDIPRLQRFGA